MIRRAAKSDIPAILEVLGEMYSKSPIPLGELSVLKAGSSLEAAIDTDVVFVVGTPIVGVLALRRCTFWYSEGSFLADLVYYVKKDKRASRYAAGLLREAQSYATMRQLPLLMAVTYGEDVARKDAFFQRMGMHRIGGVYQRG